MGMVWDGFREVFVNRKEAGLLSKWDKIDGREEKMGKEGVRRVIGVFKSALTEMV